MVKLCKLHWYQKELLLLRMVHQVFIHILQFYPDTNWKRYDSTESTTYDDKFDPPNLRSSDECQHLWYNRKRFPTNECKRTTVLNVSLPSQCAHVQS